ncbi:MAG: DUF7305 domain-containing protein [Planctomycetota bacterium]|jgi:hypothetical protein
MNRITLQKSKDRGFALALVLLTVMVFFATGVGLLALGLRNRMLATDVVSDIAARTTADAALELALYRMNRLLKADNLQDDMLPSVAYYTALPNSETTFTYNVTGNWVDGYRIEGVGKSGRSEKMVSCDVKQQGLFREGLFSTGNIILKNGTTVDWYNSSDDEIPNVICTSSNTAGAINIKEGVTINGDIAIGPDGNPDTVIDGMAESTITGEVYVMAEKRELTYVKPPAYLVSALSGGEIIEPCTITTSGKYQRINLDKGKIITINGSVELYIIGDVSLKNLAELQIAIGSSLTMYVAGDITMDNGGMINNLTKDPTKLKIYGLEGCQKVVFRTASIFYGALYTPGADVQFNNSVEVYGAIVAESIEQMQGANVHYDAALLKPENLDKKNTELLFGRWSDM